MSKMPVDADGSQYPLRFPHFGHATAATHRKATGNSRAGYPDILLFINTVTLRDVLRGQGAPAYHGYNLSGEVKPPWSYPNEDLDHIFSTVTAERNTGRFSWMWDTISQEIIVQVRD